MADTVSSRSVGLLQLGDRPLPHNREAEMAVLGAMLVDPLNAIDVAASRLQAADSFYDPTHQKIFTCLTELAGERARSTIDLLTVQDALSRAGVLEQIGGRPYLVLLMDSVPTAANVEQYVQMVSEMAMLRRVIKSSAQTLEKCFEPQEDIKAFLDCIESDILKITGESGGKGPQAVGDMIMGAIEYMDQLHSGEKAAMGLQTGFEDLDRLITGLRAGEMTVIAARPSIGKTALALNMAANMALRGERVAVGFFSLEMDARLLVLRMLCSEARVSLSDIKEGALSTARWQEITEAGQRLRNAPIFVDDTGSLDLMDLRTRARRLKLEHDIKIIFIDYLQLLRVNVGKNATRENEVSRMSGGIKALAKELEVPVVVLAQLNRQAEQVGQRPRLSHLRESGAIEQDADVVALLHRDRDAQMEDGEMSEKRESELIVAKHRNGPTGIVPLTFIPGYTRFESRSRIPDEDVPDV